MLQPPGSGAAGVVSTGTAGAAAAAAAAAQALSASAVRAAVRTRAAHGGGYFTPRARPGTGLVLLARALATVFLRAAALAAARGLWPACTAGLARGAR